tara:strand:- start:322 stop:546 length:225 start_codon:yes stop_codon:yes gene_type:complete
MYKKQKYPLLNRIYQHYKGGTYKVLHLAKNTTNDEITVVYQSQEFGSYYTRPLSEWFDDIEKENCKRFCLMEFN